MTLPSVEGPHDFISRRAAAVLRHLFKDRPMTVTADGRMKWWEFHSAHLRELRVCREGRNKRWISWTTRECIKGLMENSGTKTRFEFLFAERVRTALARHRPGSPRW